MHRFWLVVFLLIIQSNYFRIILANIAVNQFKYCSCQSWNASSITEDDTIYTLDRMNRRIHVNFTHSLSLFVVDNEEIFVDNGYLNHRIDRWILNTNSSKPVMNVNSSCVAIFVDVSNNLYCSAKDEHRVLKVTLNSKRIAPTVAAGTGCPGPIPNMLDHPHGIFVDTESSLYVADTDNNRIQLFPINQLNAITVAGFGSTTGFLLNRPTDIIVDIDSNLFIVENGNNRIILLTSTGFQRIISDQLQNPRTMYFDRDGNIFVNELDSRRIQKFILSKNSCHTELNSYLSTIKHGTWMKIPGRMMNSGIGGAGQIWAVNNQSTVFYKAYLNARWTQMDGALTYISVGAGGHVFGVNQYDEIFYRANASNSNPKGSDWIQIDGKAVKVAVTSTGGIWALNRSYIISYRTGINENWEVIDGRLVQISVGANGEVWGVNINDSIYYREGSSNINPKGQTWQHKFGHARCTAVDAHGQIWFTNRWHNIWFAQDSNLATIKIIGNLSFITVAQNGLVLGHNLNGYTFYRQNTIFC